MPSRPTSPVRHLKTSTTCSPFVSSLVDKHAPLPYLRDAGCCGTAATVALKHRTRRISGAYTVAVAHQSSLAYAQPRNSSSKDSVDCSGASRVILELCHRDPRKLWCIIGQLLQQNSSHLPHNSAAVIAAYFTWALNTVLDIGGHWIDEMKLTIIR